MLRQARQRLRADLRPAFQLDSQAGQDGLGQYGYVRPALPQGRYADLERGQAVEQVPAEAAALNIFLQIGIGGGDDSHIGFQLLHAAHRAE